MNDARIQELVRMALEVDELEGVRRPAVTAASAGAADPRGVVVRRLFWAGAALAAAAAVAVMVSPLATRVSTDPGAGRMTAGLGPSMAAPGAARDPGEVGAPAHADYTVALEPRYTRRLNLQDMIRPAPAPAPAGVVGARLDPEGLEQCVVMAIYRDPLGAMHCVQMKPHEWQGNRCLTEVPPSELRSVWFGRPCAEPASTLVVALSGPRRALPKNEEGAVALARCILGLSESCEAHGQPCLQRAAVECVPSEVSVRVETVAARSN
jgi:hypothetical protein